MVSSIATFIESQRAILNGPAMDQLIMHVAVAIEEWVQTPIAFAGTGTVVGAVGSGVVRGTLVVPPCTICDAIFQSSGLNGQLAQPMAAAIINGTINATSGIVQYESNVVGIGAGTDSTFVTFASTELLANNLDTKLRVVWPEYGLNGQRLVSAISQCLSWSFSQAKGAGVVVPNSVSTIPGSAQSILTRLLF